LGIGEYTANWRSFDILPAEVGHAVFDVSTVNFDECETTRRTVQDSSVMNSHSDVFEETNELGDREVER
jgi:hypothetical protein